MMYVWNQRLVVALLAVFIVLQVVFWATADGGSRSVLPARATYWLATNSFLLWVWVFIWMCDQARVRGKHPWVWLLPFLIAPLPTLAAFVLALQRRVR